MSDQNRAEKIEKVLNAIQWAGAIPGPQKLYLQLLLGQAGIPSEYKIHSSTLESLVRIETQSDYMQRTFDSIDKLKR